MTTFTSPESVSEPEKLANVAADGDGGSPRAFEYDHVVSLALGLIR